MWDFDGLPIGNNVLILDYLEKETDLDIEFLMLVMIRARRSK